MTTATAHPAQPRRHLGPDTGRPLTRGEQTIAVVVGLWMVVGLFLDGWAHDNNKPETFFTPWHGVLYAGFGAAALAAAMIVWRSREPGTPWHESLPHGHRLTLAALGLFFVAAVGDLLWHELLGVEVGIEALLSPTHLLLLVAGVVALSAPVRAAWMFSLDEPPSLKEFAPTILGFALLTALIGFFLLFLSPFLNDAAGTGFERLPGATHDHPSSDPAELRQVLGIGSILITTVLYSVPSYLMLRRWRPPFGTLTAFYGFLTLLFVGLDEFSTPALIIAGLLGGGAADIALRRLPAWAAVPLGNGVLWLAYFGIYQLGAGGVEWTAPIWTGAILLSTLASGGLGLLVAPLRDREADTSTAVVAAGR